MGPASPTATTSMSKGKIMRALWDYLNELEKTARREMWEENDRQGRRKRSTQYMVDTMMTTNEILDDMQFQEGDGTVTSTSKHVLKQNVDAAIAAHEGACDHDNGIFRCDHPRRWHKPPNSSMISHWCRGWDLAEKEKVEREGYNQSILAVKRGRADFGKGFNRFDPPMSYSLRLRDCWVAGWDEAKRQKDVEEEKALSDNIEFASVHERGQRDYRSGWRRWNPPQDYNQAKVNVWVDGWDLARRDEECHATEAERIRKAAKAARQPAYHYARGLGSHPALMPRGATQQETDKITRYVAGETTKYRSQGRAGYTIWLVDQRGDGKVYNDEAVVCWGDKRLRDTILEYIEADRKLRANAALVKPLYGQRPGEYRYFDARTGIPMIVINDRCRYAATGADCDCGCGNTGRCD